jgi:hypothetical protein
MQILQLGCDRSVTEYLHRFVVCHFASKVCLYPNAIGSSHTRRTLQPCLNHPYQWRLVSNTMLVSLCGQITPPWQKVSRACIASSLRSGTKLGALRRTTSLRSHLHSGGADVSS